MLKFKLLAAVAATLLAGGTAVAEEKVAKPSKDKKICKGEVSTTSRIAKKRICKTRAEWNAMSNQDDLDAAEDKLRNMGRSD